MAEIIDINDNPVLRLRRELEMKDQQLAMLRNELDLVRNQLGTMKAVNDLLNLQLTDLITTLRNVQTNFGVIADNLTAMRDQLPKI